MKPIRFFIVFFAFFSVSMLQSEELRTFTGSNGKAIEGALLGFDSDMEIVKIRLKNGKENNVKLSLFSSKDQQWIKNQGKNDNPFEGSEIVYLSIFENEFNDVEVRLRTTDHITDETFEGNPFQFRLIPKAKVLKGENNTVQITHDFADSDPINSFGFHVLSKRENGLTLNHDHKTLELHGKYGPSERGYPEAYVAMLRYARLFKMPIRIELAIEEKSITTGTVQIKLEGLRIRLNRNQDGLFHCIGNWMGEPPLFEEKAIKLDKDWKKKFRLPLPSTKNDFNLSVEVAYITEHEEKPLQIRSLQISGVCTTNIGVGFSVKDSILFVVGASPHGSGAKSGIEAGDVIKSINGKTVQNAGDALTLIGNTSVFDDIIMKIERRGEEKEIIIKTDW